MASAFWTLEDGRSFARDWLTMANMLELITNELISNSEAEDFYHYLEKYVFRLEKKDEPNGHGGFFRGNENIMFNIDLRTFAPMNRDYFWEATQIALTKLLILKNEKNEEIISLMTILLDMHKRIKKGEDPMKLNHMRIITPLPKEKLGPGW